MKKITLGNQSQRERKVFNMKGQAKRENKIFHMPKVMPNNKKGDMAHLMVALLMGFMAIAMLVSLIPGFVEILDTAQNSEGLNCKGYTYNGDPTNPLSYNSTIGTKSTIGCLAVKLYLPYIVLAVLLGVVMYILYDKSQSAPPYYGG